MSLPSITDLHLSLAPRCLPRRTEDPAAVSPRLLTDSGISDTIDKILVILEIERNHMNYCRN
jgi:hypothetical protein